MKVCCGMGYYLPAGNIPVMSSYYWEKVLTNLSLHSSDGLMIVMSE